MTMSPAEFMSAAPRAVGGDTPWAARYAGELRRVFLEHAAEAPRTLQQHLGPSELGVECDRQVAGKLAALPRTNHVVDPWPSIRGTALHAWAADAFVSDNARRAPRWLAENRVTPHPEHPGTADLYDGQEQAVVDHKFLATSSMTKIRNGWPRKYKVQLLLYGLGYWLLGLPVRRIAVAAYPATAGSLDGIYVRELPFAGADNQILPEVLELLHLVLEVDTPRRKQQAAAILAGQLRLMDVPAAPDDDECYFCPFYRPQAAKDSGPGCPGSVAAAPRSAAAPLTTP